jgi:hypothetical protein
MSPGRTLLVTLAALAGCAAPVQAGGEPVGSSAQAIAGGSADPGDTNVVSIVWQSRSGVQECSGALLAPNLVLTAHHCVADVLNKAGGADCATSQFAPPDAASSLFVSTREQISSDPAGMHPVGEIVVPPGSTGTTFCGFDLAMLILSDDVQPGEAVPLVPRLDGEIAPADAYAAVGFGDTSDGTGDPGTRRRLDGLLVDCVGPGCASTTTGQAGQIDTQREWIGDHGACQGDSGGPALDASNRVVGVVSRSEADCAAPIYGDVYSWAAWIGGTAQRAAAIGNYPAPAWASGYSPDPLAGSNLDRRDPTSGASGCDIGEGEPAGPVPWLLGAAAWAIARRRLRGCGPAQARASTSRGTSRVATAHSASRSAPRPSGRAWGTTYTPRSRIAAAFAFASSFQMVTKKPPS